MLHIETLQTEKKKDARIGIPETITKIIKAYQEAHKLRYGTFIKKEPIIYKLFLYGKDNVQHEIDTMISEFKNYNNDK